MGHLLCHYRHIVLDSSNYRDNDLSEVFGGGYGLAAPFFFKNSSYFKNMLYFCHQNIIIMSQSAYTIRLDSDLKNRFDALCEGFGMSASTAFNIFVRTVVRKRKIPFEIEMSEEEEMMEIERRNLEE